MSWTTCFARKPSYKWLFPAVFFFVALLFGVGCDPVMPSGPASEDRLDEPIEGLTGDQMDLHVQGDEDFAKVFSKEDGLGPIFVQNSCESCHVADGKGSPANALTRFGRYDSAGNWDPLPEFGGPQLQNRSIVGSKPEALPNGVKSTELIAPNVTGLGFFAALEDETILERADPNDADGDGISGAVNLVDAPPWLDPDERYHEEQPGGKYIGRFGRKAATIDLTHQTVTAYKEDIGITSPFDQEDPVNHAISEDADDGVADPEISAGTVRKVVFYLKTLKAPPRRNADDPAVEAGGSVFERIGCEKCHRATMTTGPSPVEALDRKRFHPYTDLLMHDMGPELDDGYKEGSVGTAEWRTPPLWGLGLQKDVQGGRVFLMHDGRAESFEEAIRLHGGEAKASRKAYKALSDEEKEHLVEFLGSL